jgi:NAD(P)-dependent dehydrogenase (short-subunit alcohol dehydrogenase family)
MMSVAGKVSLVTGAASGIGRAIAIRLAREGSVVLVTDINERGGEACAAEIRDGGGDAVFQHHDVSSEAAWIEVATLVERRWGRLNVLVNNAGIAIFSPVVDLSFDDWRKTLAIDLDSVFLGTKYCLPILRRSGGGAIINISSVAGLKGQVNLPAYCAAKGGVRLFSKSVALECAAAKDGVRVNSVHPGIIDTPIFNSVPGEPSVDLASRAAVVVPVGRAGKAEEVAAMVLYLASDEAQFVTGAEFVIDGGSAA